MPSWQLPGPATRGWSVPNDTDIHLCHLFAGQSDGWIEIAHGWRDPKVGLRMASRNDPANYFPVTNPAAAAARARKLARRGEVFIGVVPRASAGITGRRGVRHVGQVVWLDIDDPHAAVRAARFGPAPHLAIASGGGGVHLYWLLDRVLPVEALERINRRLALHLGGDPAACDRARLLRVAGTPHKTPGICARILTVRDTPPVSPGRLLAWVPRPVDDAPAERPRQQISRVALRMGDRDPVRGLFPHVWFAAITGVEPDEWGSVRCPLPDHDDSTASCHVYRETERGWWCFGCARGGSAYDLASLLSGGQWGRDLRGDEFRAAKRAVYHALGIRTETDHHRKGLAA